MLTKQNQANFFHLPKIFFMFIDDFSKTSVAEMLFCPFLFKNLKIPGSYQENRNTKLNYEELYTEELGN